MSNILLICIAFRSLGWLSRVEVDNSIMTKNH